MWFCWPPPPPQHTRLFYFNKTTVDKPFFYGFYPYKKYFHINWAKNGFKKKLFVESWCIYYTKTGEYKIGAPNIFSTNRFNIAIKKQ